MTSNINDINPQVIEQHNAFLSSNSGLDSSARHHTPPTTLKSREKNEKINKHTTPTKIIKESYGKIDYDIVSFEHININGNNPHIQFMELTHTVGVLEKWDQEYLA